jgi:hypothetical protein
MSTAGLRKVGNYEEVLAQAIKDEQHVDGIISPYLQNQATKIINSPEFQRVKDRLEDNLMQQTKDHAEQRNFETHVQGLAVEARINKSDLQYIIENLQQPPPPPPPPPPHSDTAADRARLIAELDGLAQEREKRMRDEMTAQQNARDLAAQSVATPAQQIVREFHHHTQQPIYIPTPQVPPATPVHIHTPQQDYSDMMRQFGMTMQQIFLAQQQVQVQRRPPEDIPITYTTGGGGPPPPPGGGREMVRSFGPTRMPKERMAPFQGGGPPPAPGGATAPMPTPQRVNISRETVPIRRDYFPSRPEPPPAPSPPPPPTPQPARKRKAPKQEGPVTLKPYRQPRGPGHKLPDEPPAFVPFSGQAQRLPDEHNLRANAVQRMREVHEQGMQRRRGREMVDRMSDLGRAIRRGGARGDIVGPGKRKREEEEFAPDPRRRVGAGPAGPQRFSIAT